MTGEIANTAPAYMADGSGVEIRPSANRTHERAAVRIGLLILMLATVEAAADPSRFRIAGLRQALERIVGITAQPKVSAYARRSPAGLSPSCRNVHPIASWHQLGRAEPTKISLGA
jgi:hypothetical protein